MENYKTLAISVECGVAAITLNRPEIRNAFDDLMLHELRESLRALAVDESVTALVLTGAGKAFCSGADFGWMQRMVDYSYRENLEDAEELASCLGQLDSFPRPTIAKVNGAVMGGGMGLVAACDIAVAVEDALFGFPEVRVGLAPATIGPYVLRRIGASACRRYFLTGERFAAGVAQRLGLVSEVVRADELEETVQRIVRSLAAGGPKAQTACKELVEHCLDLPLVQLKDYTAELIASLRVSSEGQEGLRAALSKRKPRWQEERCSEKS